MPLNASGWTTEEDESLAELVKPHKHLYNVSDPSRKNILARESTWQDIAQKLLKPVEDCKKRWRGLRDGYMRSKRTGVLHWTKTSIFQKLLFLDQMPSEDSKDKEMVETQDVGAEQQVITDNQEYYEFHNPHMCAVKDHRKYLGLSISYNYNRTSLQIHVVDPQEPVQQLIKIVPKVEPCREKGILRQPPKKVRRTTTKKKSLLAPQSISSPIKILPKPVLMNGPKLLRYVDETKTPEQRSQTIDKLIEKVLKENTNEIDVFFRSMAATVKKLQPNLIPKVKMEVCNVIAKYEMQSIEGHLIT